MIALFVKMLKINKKETIMSISQLILTGLLTTLVFTQPIQAAGVKWLTLVSLTFDDGKNESNARAILASHGMHGTFYINTNRIGIGNGFLTRAELDALYSDGNEIGGHTIGHVDLATLSDTEQRTAICEDMSVLINWGYDVHSFAYPFSSTNSSTQNIVEQGCPGIGGYESARAVGGLRTATSCTNCPTAESLSPSNSRYILTPPSIKSSTTLADLKSYITQAEANGGGWVPLVFHNICDGCSNLAVSPDILDEFLTWLEARTSQGTHVRTVHQVISGDYPGTTPTPTVGANILLNPSLENDNDADNQPDCWLRNEYGNNQANWMRSTDAHTGNFSEQLTVTSYINGDSKLLISPDAGQSQGGCSPMVEAGSTYQLSVWYKSTTLVVPELFYLDASNVWQYWRKGTQMPASDSWNQMVFYPGSLPTGAQSISFGMSLQSVGILITDDYSIVKVGDSQPTGDNIAPVISNVIPESGTTVSGDVPLIASVTDNVGVKRVEFLINNSLIATDTSNPYKVTWNSGSISNGETTLIVKAFDAAGNSVIAPAVKLKVNNQPNQSANLLTNPSLEIDADNNNIADCWLRGGYGDNSFSWTRLSGSATAHSGNFSESLRITSLSSGNRKLVSSQGSTRCSPNVINGQKYTLSSWYKSTIPTRMSVYYQTTQGKWKYWVTSPWSPATNSWKKALYTTPPIPNGAKALSFGLSLGNIGTLITDDYSMTIINQ